MNGVSSLATEKSVDFSVVDSTLSRLVGRESLQKIQDRFSALGKVTACIGSTDGDFITRPTWGSRYSRLIATSPRGHSAFGDSIRACCLDPQTSVTSICHDSLTLYVAPISHDIDCLGILVVGTRPITPLTDDQIRSLATQYEIDVDELTESARELEPWNPEALEATYQFANVLADTIASLYEQADYIERQLRDLQAVHSLSQLLAGTRDVQEILDLTVKRVAETMQVKSVAIRLLEEATGELVIKAVHNLSKEYLNKGPVTLDGNYIDSAAFAGHAVYIEDAPTDMRLRYPEDARQEGIVSGLCVPMTYRGKTVGVLRAYTAERYVFNKLEESLLLSMGSLAASAIINSRLFAEQAANARVHQQVEAAADIQRNMLPNGTPKLKGLEFGTVYSPTLRVSGDFYDFIGLHGGELGVCVADVVGKGIPAALRMAAVRASLRAFANVGYDVHTIMELVNRQLCRDTQLRDFVTLIYGEFTPDGRMFNYCNAGHLPPLLLREDRYIDLDTGGLVIGIRPRETYDEEPVVIRTGDVLVMVTDGVTEALNFSGEPYGFDRLRESIKRHRVLDAQALAQQLLWDVRRFAGLADQSDDITIVVIKAVEVT